MNLTKWPKINSKTMVPILMGPLLLIIFFQNCAKNQGEYHQSSNAIVDPFAEKKVHLSSKLLSTNNAPVPTIPENTTVSVLIDKVCSLSLCRQDSNSIACNIYSDPLQKKNKDGRYQFFTFTFNESISLSDLKKNIELSDEDSSCLVGMSENLLYLPSVYNDPSYEQQKTAYDKISFFDVENIPLTKLADVKVAVIDTGVESSEDLPVVASEDLRSYDFSTDSNCPKDAYEDYYGHGTAVASIIGSIPNNSKGLTGIAPNAKIISFRIGRCSDSAASTVEIGNGILRAIDYKADIINISYGGNTGDDISLRSAITRALGQNIIIVAAAGNNDMDINKSKFYPASYSNGYSGVIGVGASDNNYKKAAFSNYGTDSIEIAAPGVNLPVAASKNCKFCVTQWTDSSNLKIAWASGTSFSAPIVSGAVALIIGYLKKKSSSYDANYIEQILVSLSTSNKSDLVTVAKNGALIDFRKLNAALVGLDSTTAVTNAMSVSTDFSGTGADTKYIVKVTLNLSSLPPGARIGIYDMTCEGTAIECLIQDQPLVKGPKGSYTFTLSRNDFVPMDPGAININPSYSLPFKVSVHYPKPSKDHKGNIIPGKFENNHGEAAIYQMDVRNINFSNNNSEFKGEITNIRYDMRYLYVSGWTCIVGNNAAMKVELRNAKTQVPISVNFDVKDFYKTYGAFQTELPQGAVAYNRYKDKDKSATWIDENWDVYYLHEEKIINDIGPEWPIVPNLLKARFKNTGGISFPAGMVASGKTVLECNTFTSAHGFEIAVPLRTIEGSALSEQFFQVISTNGSKSKFISDAQGRTQFTFPKPNFKPIVSQNIQLTREGANWRIQGSLCTRSRAPSDLHVFSTHQQYYDSFYNLKIQQGSGPGGEFINDPNYVGSKNNKIIRGGEMVFSFRVYIVKRMSGRVDIAVSDEQVYVEKETLDDDMFNYYSRIINNAIPGNARLFGDFNDLDPSQIVSLNSELNKLGLRQIYTGKALDFKSGIQKSSDTGLGLLRENELLAESGLKAITDINTESSFYGTTGFITNDSYAKFDLKGEAANYLKENYSVTSLQKERKVYESLLTTGTSVGYFHIGSNRIGGLITPTAGHASFGFFNMQFSGQGQCSPGQYQQSINLTIRQMDWTPKIEQSFTHFGILPEKIFLPVINTEEAMKRLSMNIRVFQDGVLVLQLLAPMGQGFKDVPLPD